MLFVWFFLAGLIILFTPQEWTGVFQSLFARVFSVPLRVSRSITLSAQTQQQPTDYVSKREYIRLRNHLANLEQWLKVEQEKVNRLSGLRNRFGLD